MPGFGKTSTAFGVSLQNEEAGEDPSFPDSCREIDVLCLSLPTQENQF